MFEDPFTIHDLIRLAKLAPRELIARFDQDFDSVLRRYPFIGLLEANAAFSAGARDLAVIVGAYWCRIVQWDREHELFRSLEAVTDSQGHANALREVTSVGGFEAYVLARWHDASGRIQFRCGDMVSARLAFELACDTAQAAEPWRCLPDMRSNWLRANFDEREQAGEHRNLVNEARKFTALLAAVETEAKERGLALRYEQLGEHLDDTMAQDQLPAPRQVLRATLGLQDDDESRRRGEFLRGLANIYHKTSIVWEPNSARNWKGDLDRALKLARASATLAYGLGDEYCLAQALRHRAALYLRHADTIGDDAEARAQRWFEVLHNCWSWRRGRWIAAQSLARLSPSLATAERLRDILAELETRRRERGEESGFDVDLYRYTVAALRSIQPALPEADRTSTQELHVSELAAAASIRRVVKVATYRARVAQVINPVYLAELDRARDRACLDISDVEALEELLARVEEVMARDLLDTLVDVSRSGAQPDQLPPIEGQAQNAKRTDETRSSLVRSGPDSAAYIAVNQARQDFETVALQRPVTFIAHDAEFSSALRCLTAIQPGLSVVRYFPTGWVDGHPRHINALLAQRGRLVLVEFDTDAIRALLNAPSPPCPSPTYAAALWRLFIAPIWVHVEAQAPRHPLVLIPAPGMFSLPLHVATPDAEQVAPLCTRIELSFSVSATALVTHWRYLLRTQPRDPRGDLCALAPEQVGVYPGELENVEWPRESFHLAGFKPVRLQADHFQYCGDGDQIGLHRLLATQAELFVFAGHGVSVSTNAGGVEIVLKLANDEFLTQYDLATSLRMRRNKWAVLGACVSGLGGDTASGEVSGFIRSFIAAGAGALAVSLWPVADALMAEVVGQLLRGIAACSDKPFDIVRSLYEIQNAMVESSRSWQSHSREVADDDDPLTGAERLLKCPLLVYL
ncbi:CHAT domain-containing protein [Pseudenhygromyxa sp. WMMC2535]|uniref:CHAT domain-containing protein n=1 Tax=Pseudenhygromyxa sp. WMMC2535 TaxID=2712867 RepID=UPI001C3C5D31|nr:CHAT domain-containing protein [Pseudenhygromyxa sp. WMMC2535]